MTTSMARRERDQLCDTALSAGATAPTLCGDWDVQHLVAHLLVRERSVIGAPGILLPPLAGLTDRETDRMARRDLGRLVGEVRKARGFLSLPVVDQLTNTLEFFVHHEDIRRAQPDWSPRDLSPDDQATLWRAISVSGRGLVRPAGVPVVLRNTLTGQKATLRRGSNPVEVSGPPAELVMFLFGRAQTRGLEFAGSEAAVTRLRAARLGL
jgi:uncharacterized protein (TIGR03085 family)